MSNRATSSNWIRPAIGLLCLLAGTGCSSFTVVRQAEPNPFRGVGDYGFTSLEYVDLHVDGMPESQYLARREDEREKWEAIKDDVKRRFEFTLRSRLQGAGIDLGADSDYVVRATISAIDSGYYRIPAWNAVSRLNIRFLVTHRSGAVLDEVLLDNGVNFDALANPTVGGRLRQCAETAADNAAGYLTDRSR